MSDLGDVISEAAIAFALALAGGRDCLDRAEAEP